MKIYFYGRQITYFSSYMAPGYYTYLLRNAAVCDLAGKCSRKIFRFCAISNELTNIPAQRCLQYRIAFKKFYRVNYLGVPRSDQACMNPNNYYCQKFLHTRFDNGVNEYQSF